MRRESSEESKESNAGATQTDKDDSDHTQEMTLYKTEAVQISTTCCCYDSLPEDPNFLIFRIRHTSLLGRPLYSERWMTILCRPSSGFPLGRVCRPFCAQMAKLRITF